MSLRQRVVGVQVLVEELPIMWFLPCDAGEVAEESTLRTPVYVTQARRDAMGAGLVFVADLAVEGDTGSWILQGVALFLDVNY